MPPKRVIGKQLGRQAGPGAARTGSSARSIVVEITLPPTYYRRLIARKTERGVSKSEAIRQFMDEAESGRQTGMSARTGDAGNGQITCDEKTVLREVAGQIRVLAVKLGGRLRLIDQPTDLAAEIEKLTERLLLAL